MCVEMSEREHIVTVTASLHGVWGLVAISQSPPHDLLHAGDINLDDARDVDADGPVLRTLVKYADVRGWLAGCAAGRRVSGKTECVV